MHHGPDELCQVLKVVVPYSVTNQSAQDMVVGDHLVSLEKRNNTEVNVAKIHALMKDHACRKFAA